MRRAALLAFAAAAVFAGVAGTPLRGARAEDPPVAPPPQDAFAVRAPDAARASAAKLWAAAEDARRVQLFEWARREARRVLDLDPDHKGARAFLGFVKKDASWVEDAELAAKWPATNFAGTRSASMPTTASCLQRTGPPRSPNRSNTSSSS